MDGHGTIVVVGHGSASVVPDEAVLGVGLEVRAGAPADALRQVSARAAAVVEAARDAGIDGADLQTGGVSVSPEWDHQGAVRTLIGYSATYQLAIRLHEVTAAASLLDALAAPAGDALRLRGLDLTPSDLDAPAAEAARRAVEDARAKAAVLAEAAGASLGPVLAIADEGGSRHRHRMFEAAGRPIPPAGMPVEAGTQEVTASVRVTFALR